MDLFQVIQDRRSIRRYKDTPIEQEKIEKILGAASMAPSWRNMQCWRFLVVREQAKRVKVLDAFPANNPGKNAIATAPVVILACADTMESGVAHGISYYIADTAIAFEHLCLTAHALGLGTCWMGSFDEEKIKQLFSIPDQVRIVGITPLGYPDQQPNPRPRKGLSEIAFYDEWTF